MKILLFADLHFCEYSSILRKEGSKYSIRLEKLIDTLNWIEDLAIKNNCDRVISLGDFFDKPNLNSREITALNEIKWSNIPHYFLVGNHEASTKSLCYNSTNVLQKLGFEIIDKAIFEDFNDFSFLYLPYISNIDDQKISDYYSKLNANKYTKRIIFSHNDVKGIQYGAFKSEVGFDVADIDENCDMFLNGHLHNSVKFSKKGFNLGNVSGQNFSEDALTYPHCVYILDTAEMNLEYIDNPYALNFYKVNIYHKSDFNVFDSIKINSVLSIKCSEKLISKVYELLNIHKNKILETRINITYDNKQDINLSTEKIITSKIDYLDKFSQFCIENFDNKDLLLQELSIICK